VPGEDAVPYPQPVSVLFQMENAPRAMYEPNDGVYLAGWLASHTAKRGFNLQAGRNHAVYVHEMYLCDEFPHMWLLECMAALATPLIILHPPVDADCPVPIGDRIEYFARRLGLFQMPMFVVYHPPCNRSMVVSAAEYTLIFRYARALFLAHAPQAAFVWLAPDTTVTPRNAFFPGHDAVDWVGVSLSAVRGQNGLDNVIDSFAPFYHNFQAHHPVMVLPLGVSHFSRLDYTYRITEASDEISRLYRALLGFPRVGLVAYADAFGLTYASRLLGHNTPTDDFAVSIESELMEAYAAAVANPLFLSMLEREALPLAHGQAADGTSTQPAPRWVRSPNFGYFYDGAFYVDVETLNSLNIATPRGTVAIGDRSFVEMDRLEAVFCRDRYVILLMGNSIRN